MRAGRYDVSLHPHAMRWPFAVREHEVRVAPLIAPEFQATFERILLTSRYYFHIERRVERQPRRNPSSSRR